MPGTATPSAPPMPTTRAACEAEMARLTDALHHARTDAGRVLIAARRDRVLDQWARLR